jgi:hypothetical protein
MLKKGSILIISGLFIGASLFSGLSGGKLTIENSVPPSLTNGTSSTPLILFSDDEIDQQQTKFDGALFLIHRTQWISQSFIPRKSVVTRVFLYLYKWNNIDYEITVSIRKELEDDDLTSVSFIPNLISPPNWLEVDFNDIAVNPGESYYIVCRTNDGTWEDAMCYGWGFTYDYNSYLDGLVYVTLNRGIHWDVWIDELMNITLDSCFMTYGYNDPNAKADLECTGNLNWKDIQTGEPISGDFIIENSGFNGSLLDWEITSYPSWGGWTFSPSSGDDLTPAAGAVTVQVSCIAPSEANQEFTGEIKIVNKEDTNDFCILQVQLTTPKHSVVTSPLWFYVLEQLFSVFHCSLDY